MMNGASGLQPFEQGWNQVKMLLRRSPEAVGTVKKPLLPISMPSAVTAEADRASAVLLARRSGVRSSGVAAAEPQSTAATSTLFIVEAGSLRRGRANKM